MRDAFVVSIAILLVSPVLAQQTAVTDLPEVRKPFTLYARYDSQTGQNAFSFAGATVPPVIRVVPGNTIKLRYVNRLPANSREKCALGPCTNRSNLHFHGLHVSPERPQDDVLTMTSMPGQRLNYKVDVPSNAPPGLYWYHTHPHGESARQDLDGMSGAIVIEGIDRYYPELRHMAERVLILRDREIEHDANRQQILRQVEVPVERCGTSPEQKVERVFTLNGNIRPRIAIPPGQRELWRIVNASPDLYADIQLPGQQLEIVALDGMPLSYHDGSRRTDKMDHILLAPAGRAEAIVSSPPAGTNSTLSTRCVDTGPDGDPNPAMVIADVVSDSKASSRHVPITAGQPVYKEIASRELEKLEASNPDFIAVFTEDKNGFYINGKKFSMDSEPMLRVRIGSLQHWRVVNDTGELHPFHIHQIHFLAYGENGVRSQIPEWLDTTNVPYRGSVDLIMDFTDPIIRGMSVFHCHILSHEDKGMMAKILFE